MSASGPALALEGVTVTFVSPDGGRYTAVRDTTLRIQPGEFVSVVGPTGCGKSTLLNVAVGLLQPSAGRVQVFGEPLAGLNARHVRRFRHSGRTPLLPSCGRVRILIATGGPPVGSLPAHRSVLLASRSGYALRERERGQLIALARIADRLWELLSGGA